MTSVANYDVTQYMTENLKDFRPFAYYDKHLDCIRVQIRDCSVIEERLSKFITFLRRSHGHENEYIGFTIKGIRHLFVENEWPLTGVKALTEVIDAIVKAVPHAAVKKLKDEFTGKIDDLSVDMGMAA